MAEVVIGIGTSHSPQLSIRANDWDYLLKKDQTDPRLDYPSLLKRAKPGIEAELTPEKFRRRDEACLKALESLGEAEARAAAEANAGRVDVHCEFCGQSYRFDGADLDRLFATPTGSSHDAPDRLQ